MFARPRRAARAAAGPAAGWWACRAGWHTALTVHSSPAFRTPSQEGKLLLRHKGQSGSSAVSSIGCLLPWPGGSSSAPAAAWPGQHVDRRPFKRWPGGSRRKQQQSAATRRGVGWFMWEDVHT